MEQLTEVYGPTILVFGAIGGLLLVQLLIADVLGLMKGHAPGTPITDDHDNALFRAVRAHANTNESIAAFVVLALFAMAVSADPAWTNALCLAYLLGRMGHMSCYYADLRVLRSVCFGLSVIALIGLLIVAWASWIKG